MNQTSLSAIPGKLPPRGEDFTRFMNLLHESESLGLKNDYDSRIRQFNALFEAVFGNNDYSGYYFSIILVNELINEAQNLIRFYFNWEPLKRLMSKIADRVERIDDDDETHLNDPFLSAALDRALEWHQYDIATRIATSLQDHIAKLDTISDNEERELRLKLGMRVAKIHYLNALKSNNQDSAQIHLDKFKIYIEQLGVDEKDQLNKLKESVKNYNSEALSFINFIDRKATQKKNAGNSRAVLGIYYNALNSLLSTPPKDDVRHHVIPYLLQNIFMYQVPRISEAIKKEKFDKALEYTLTILCCLGGIMPGKKAEAKSLSNDYLADGGNALLESIKKFVKDNIPMLTSTHFKGQEHRRYLLGYMADLVEECWENLSELCPNCGKLLESVALHLAVTFMENDKNKEQTYKESVDATRLFYFFYEKASGKRKSSLLDRCKNAVNQADDNKRKEIIASLRLRIFQEVSYHESFIELRKMPETAFPETAPDIVLDVKKGLCALKKQLDSEAAATESGKNLHDAILDFLHYSADSLLKQITSSTSNFCKLISDLQTTPTDPGTTQTKSDTTILNEVRRIEAILKFLHGRKGLPDNQFRQFVLAAIDTLEEAKQNKSWKDQGYNISEYWENLGHTVNSHGSDKTKKEVLNKIVKSEENSSYPAFNIIAMHWLRNHKGSLEKALNDDDLNNYLVKSVATYYNVIDIYETFKDLGENRTALTEILIKWVETILSNYKYDYNEEKIYPYLGLLYYETGELTKAIEYRNLYKTLPVDKTYKDYKAFTELEKRLRIIPRFESGPAKPDLTKHTTGPANDLIKALRDHKQFIYLIHEFGGQLNDAGASLTAADLVKKYRDPLFSLLKNPQLHFDTGKLLYQYVFKDKFSRDHKSFGASRKKEEWNAAIKELRSILGTENNIQAKIIQGNDRENIQFRFPKEFRYSYRTYWPSVQSALGSILSECKGRTKGKPIVEVSECDDKLRIEVISSNSKRTTDPTEKIRDNIIKGIGGHAEIVKALWGLCDFGLQYGDAEPMKILGDVSKRKQNVNPTDLVYIIHLPSIDDAGTTDNALSDSGTADTHAEGETDGNNNISMVL